MSKRCRTNRGTSSRRDATTLIDLVLTMLIMGILAAVSVPKFANSLSRFRVDAAAKRVVADLRLAQREAEATSSSRTVEFHAPAAHQYTMVGMQDLNHAGQGYQIDLSASPYDAVIAAVDFGGYTDLVFNGYGAPDSGGTVVIESGGFQKTVLVDTDSGRITIQ